MLAITLSKKQKSTIEAIFWDWISSSRRLKNIQEYMSRESFFYTRCNIKPDDMSTIKCFLLSDPCKLQNYLFDPQLQDKTKDYIYARYKDFRENTAANIVKALSIGSCPYCNQNSIPVIEDMCKSKFLGDFDHFYNKNNYPHLALCLYNLIPCCKVCNHEKLDRHNSYINNPYQKNFPETSILFRTDFDGDIAYLDGSSDKFIITIDKKRLDSSGKAENDMFKIELRYSKLKENAKDVIFKARAYERWYREKLAEDFSIFSPEEIKQHIFGYRDDHIKLPLSKFNYDIMNEFLSFSEHQK